MVNDLGPNLGRASLRERPDLDDAIHIAADDRVTLCGMYLDDTVNATARRPDGWAGCWTCLQEADKPKDDEVEKQ